MNYLLFINVLCVWKRSPEAERQPYITEFNTEYVEQYLKEERQQELEVNLLSYFSIAYNCSPLKGQSRNGPFQSRQCGAVLSGQGA